MKYVVEFEDVPCMYEDGMAFYRCKQDLSCHISQHTINSLTPYIEKKQEDVSFGYQHGYRAGFRDGSHAEQATAENNFWDFLQNLLSMDPDDFKECFGVSDFEILLDITYQEAKDKYNAWKEKRQYSYWR